MGLFPLLTNLLNVTYCLAFVAFECSRGSEFTQLMPDHILSDMNFHVLATVMDQKSEPNKLRNNRAGTSPSFNRFFDTFLNLTLDFAKRLKIYERTFFQRSTHG
tara:strand:- start:362 stop:673 length:312 start_codon:yes stop_codon:yes gene_type:complete